MSCEIIAEFCQNHNGNKSLLDEMLQSAKEGGAAYGKIQTIFAKDLAFRPVFENGLTLNGVTKTIKRPYKPEYERLKNLELTFEEQQWFVERCLHYGLKPLTTCFAKISIPMIKELGMKEIKVASYDCGSLPLIKDLTEIFDHLIISTGATYDHEIEKAANYVISSGKKLTLLHCVTIYPTPLSEAHLRRMDYLRSLTPRVGFSDHTLYGRDGVKASIAAIHLGACTIERHFTVLKADESKDGPVSIDQKGLKTLSTFVQMSPSDQGLYIKENIPEFDTMLGETKRELSHQELLNRNYYRGRFATHRGDKVIYNWDEE